MKAADLRERDDAPSRRRLDFSREWAIVAERLVWTRSVVVGDVDVNELPAIVAEHDEREEQAESEGGNDKEIDPDNLPEMRLQEGAPGGRGARRCAAHVLGDRQFGDVIAKEVEFGLDASPAPPRVLVGQAPNDS